MIICTSLKMYVLLKNWYFDISRYDHISVVGVLVGIPEANNVSRCVNF